ncbi:hypothetical protein Sxan_39720 [Streptomyces xanthophaeus]|uniref:Uncharacterized protein n=1 Tax=Streptomyces xanthophaeus TaxID=67385 RepID=A0A919GX79_9ACTN|nr:hypothetical protein Sxan_39720 [Streptomyces xanthophaeus]
MGADVFRALPVVGAAQEHLRGVRRETGVVRSVESDMHEIHAVILGSTRCFRTGGRAGLFMQEQEPTMVNYACGRRIKSTSMPKGKPPTRIGETNPCWNSWASTVRPNASIAPSSSTPTTGWES